MNDEEFDRLPVTQQLVLELLAARYRCGETLWTLSSKCGPALRRLEELGLVSVMHGVIERSVRASLTDEGRELMLSPGYVPPILQHRE